ncbi:hypothetical protein BOW53_05200 [Solemya pervernicosa gill symbiont]|uniref:Uncharacterized protein n=1 Tax=Solemya pervernicosa gill symbiont TaxID=642797 RepID=A0A1T2L851_9GAMM|nr:hypothetical protein [Solemya pervernicosa gill symbiont]OOZ41126.1 hypothetical protein BOW53_05200 [Solemya pervernicosa gill symbiont]
MFKNLSAAIFISLIAIISAILGASSSHYLLEKEIKDTQQALRKDFLSTMEGLYNLAAEDALFREPLNNYWVLVKLSDELEKEND